MFIIETVKNLAPFFMGPHHAHLPQAAQLVRNRGFADPHDLRQRTNVQFTLHERRDNAHPAGVAEGAA